MKKSTECLAKRMFTTYGKYVDNKNFLGESIPKWEDLPDKIKIAWGEVAEDTTWYIACQNTPRSRIK